MRNRNAVFGAITSVEGELFQFEGDRTVRVTVPGYRVLLEGLYRRKMPAYVEVDATDTVTRPRVPLVVRVESITDDEVMFEFSHARHRVPRDADYEDLSRRLREAKERGEWIAVAETDRHEIIDIRPFAPPFDVPRREPPGLLRRIFLWKWWPWCWFKSVSAARAQQLFDLSAAPTCNPTTVPPPCIPFLYPDDGCWGRAHEMARLMIADGACPRKVWIFGRLNTPTKNHPDCFVGWGWHVAPTLCVRNKWWWWFSTTEKVIDPALFTTPVTKAQWKGVQGDPSAQLFSEPASTFYRYFDGAIITDPAYTETNVVLATYRAQLQARSLGPDGPPPYAACP